MKPTLPKNFDERHQKAWAHKEVEIRGELIDRYSAALQNLVNTLTKKPKDPDKRPDQTSPSDSVN